MILQICLGICCEGLLLGWVETCLTLLGGLGLPTLWLTIGWGGFCSWRMGLSVALVRHPMVAWL
jgi:hypothetical protein